jgi:hypothetical protein
MVNPNQFYKYHINKFAKQQEEHYKNQEDAWLKQTTLFKANNKYLTFIAASHVSGNNPFIKFLIKAFNQTNPQFVLVERPKDTSKESLYSWLSWPKNSWNEIVWSIYLADKNHIGFAGMDVDEKMMFGPFLKLKDGIKVGILHWVILSYYSNKYGEIGKVLKNPKDRYILAKDIIIRDFVSPMGIYRYYKNKFLHLHKLEYKHLSFNEMIDAIVEETSRKYIAKKPFLELFEKEKGLNAPYGPWAPSAKYKINKINAYWDSYRNVCMINA